MGLLELRETAIEAMDQPSIAQDIYNHETVEILSISVGKFETGGKMNKKLIVSLVVLDAVLKAVLTLLPLELLLKVAERLGG